MTINEALNSAFEHLRSGNLTAAEVIYRQILLVQPANFYALHFLGVVYYRRKDFDNAIKHIKDALQHSPNYAEAYNNLGLALQEKGSFDEAAESFKKAIEIKPDFAVSYYNLAGIFRLKGDLDEAVVYYKKALEINPALTEVYMNIGLTLQEQGSLDEAVAWYEKAIQSKPDSAGAYFNMGNVLRQQGKVDASVNNFQEAVRLDPDYVEAHWNLALSLLLAGNLREGWKEYEWRWKAKDAVSLQHNFVQPLWDGSDITGKRILLHTEQGFGDTIQFVRYAPLVAQKGADVMVYCQKELASLLQNIEGVKQVVAYGDPLPPFDVHCHLLRLPLIFGTTLEDIPAQTPYLSADEALELEWKTRVGHDGAGLKVGLAWAGIPGHKNDRNRSSSLKEFLPLAQVQDAVFYSLQKGAAAREAADPPGGMKLLDYTEDLHDFSDTAALVRNLDLVISVDTAVAHLAGALAKPVWTLLPFAPDWRWLVDREDSPWYPSMRLFRQPSAGDWPGVMANVARELQDERMRSK
jgi:Tfp pilus assembly protein PilF